MIKWEYILVENLIIEDIVELGKEGWEMCGIRNGSSGVFPYNDASYFYFKRPISPTKAELGEPRFG